MSSVENVNKELSQYFQRLERLLDCPKDLRRAFLSQTRRMAEDFVQGRPDTTQKELIDYLGEPEELAQGFLETLEPEILEYHKRRKVLVRWCLIGFATAIMLLLSAWIYILLMQPIQAEITRVITIR